MKRTLGLVTASLLAISAFGINANAQQTRRTVKPAQTTQTASTTRASLTRIETQTGVFRRTLDSSIDANPSLKNSSVEYDSTSYLQDFEAQLNTIQGRSSNPMANDVRVLLSRANDLNRFIRGNALGSRERGFGFLTRTRRFGFGDGFDGFRSRFRTDKRDGDELGSVDILFFQSCHQL